MKIDIFCDSKNHPILSSLKQWIQKINNSSNKAQLIDKIDNLKGANLLFLISCNQIVNKSIRDLYEKSLVIHESDLPKGRGWSPLIWQILDGKNEITISLFKAEDDVDSGDIYKKEILKLDGTEIYKEISNKLFKVKLEMMSWAVNNFSNLKAIKQDEATATYYKKRNPKDSELNINKSLKDQFNLLRVCDPDRYPAFFRYKGKKYILTISS